jgi:hypothetical protein
MNSSTPDLAQHSPEIAAQNPMDLGIGVSSSNQTFGEVEHPAGVVETFDIDLIAKGVSTFVAGS